MKGLARRLLFAPLHPAVLKPLLTVGQRAGSAAEATDGKTPRRILVVNLTQYLGDGVMMLPFLSHLHQLFPAATIQLVTTAAIAPLFRPLAWLAAVHALPASSSGLPVWSTYLRMWQMFKHAQSFAPAGGFDLCLLPRWGTDPGLSGWYALFAGVPHVYGYDPQEDTYGHATVPGAERILTRAVRGGMHLPEAMRELRLIEVSGLAGPIDYEAERHAVTHPLQEIAETISIAPLRERLQLGGLGRYAAMAPGASSPARRWPADRFAQLAQEILRQTGMKSVVLGGPADALIGQQIHDLSLGAALNLAGKTSLPETVALLREAALLVANDSGPAHLGGGVGTPTIVLSACPTSSKTEHAGSPSRVAPVGPHVRIMQPESASETCRELCTASVPHCILALSTDRIAQEVLELMQTAHQAEAAVLRTERSTLAGAPAATL